MRPLVSTVGVCVEKPIGQARNEHHLVRQNLVRARWRTNPSTWVLERCQLYDPRTGRGHEDDRASLLGLRKRDTSLDSAPPRGRTSRRRTKDRASYVSLRRRTGVATSDRRDALASFRCREADEIVGTECGDRRDRFEIRDVGGCRRRRCMAMPARGERPGQRSDKPGADAGAIGQRRTADWITRTILHAVGSA